MARSTDWTKASANGTLSTVTTSDNITFAATLTPTANLEDATNVITLNVTGVSDLVGNVGVGSTNSNNFAIDTLRPTATITVSESALKAGETSLVTIIFSEAVNGFTNADLTIANGTLSTLSTTDNATFIDNGDGTGSVRIAPGAGTAGDYAVTILASSSSQPLTDSTSFTFTVTAPSRSPSVTDPVIGGSVVTGGTATATSGVRIDGPSSPVAEGENAVFTISLDSAPTSPVTVILDLADGTATLADGDFAPLTFDGFGAAIQFAAGETSKQVSIAVNTDSDAEADETFTLSLLDAFGATIDSENSSATAIIAGATRQISPVADQTVAAGTGPVDIVVAATSTDDSPATLSASGLPTRASLTDNADGTATITLNPTSSDVGSTSVTVTASDSNSASSETFDITVVPVESRQLNRSMVRINAGGGAVGNFSADRLFNLGNRYFTSAAIDLSDPSVPDGTPAALFQSTRWDDAGGAELSYDIPVANGDYEVRLYFAEIYGPTSQVGGRVFDVIVEGSRLNGLDVFAEVGANAALVKTFDVSTSDGSIDIDFIHHVENPDVMAIEIINRSTVSNTAPALATPPVQTIRAGGTLSIPVRATDADGDSITLISQNLPSFASFTDNGDGTGTVEVTPNDGDDGLFAIGLGATSGSQSQTDQSAFLLEVLDTI